MTILTDYLNAANIDEDDIDIFSIIYQAHMGKWSPYARLAYVDSEVSETFVSISQ